LNEGVNTKIKDSKTISRGYPKQQNQSTGSRFTVGKSNKLLQARENQLKTYQSQMK